jgi:hypothetical protein
MPFPFTGHANQPSMHEEIDGFDSIVGEAGASVAVARPGVRPALSPQPRSGPPAGAFSTSTAPVQFGQGRETVDDAQAAFDGLAVLGYSMFSAGTIAAAIFGLAWLMG